ncbi:four-carbon acid sugar kinase family protein [Anditalea andensis]|uniref:Four-carbon acid sugar kinase N-terminal domain-containing protein n=1 Tax=Anditalea andensis TaxID=1048983 RepID=A0A074KZA3_9BACT|nr:four-carbon acid sugar kinase family protein [Anditalea andensis]KEO74244.1 hypothetical protein EL17_08920 [Anditalea andensis]
MIAVIADDITGAAEIAGVCLRLGIPVSFSLSPHTIDKGILVIATDTRSKDRDSAVHINLKLARDLRNLGFSEVFKKTDSVLRGHVAAELEAIANSFSKKKILLLPINPHTGRHIRNGEYFVEGIPLHLSGFKDDPEFPAMSSDVKDLVKLKGHPIFCGQNIKDQLNEGYNIPDAESFSDMEHWVTKIDGSVLPAGSAAFFEVFIKRQYPNVNSSHEHSPGLLAPALLIAGSFHANSNKFVEEACANGIVKVEMPEELKRENIAEKDLLMWASEIRSKLEKEGKVILTLGPKMIDFPNSAAVLKKRVAIVVKKILEKTKVQELFISGGATAYAIIQEANLENFLPVQEFRAGVVRMSTNNRSLYLTFKPGSYTWPDEIKSYWTTQQNVHGSD